MKRRHTLSAVLAAALLLLGGVRAFAQEDIPEVVRSLIDEGNRHTEAGRVEDAVASYTEAQRLAPEVPAPYLALGAIYARRGEFEDAYASFTRGLEHAPESVPLLANAAIVGRRLGRYEEALGYVDQALAQDRKNGDLLALHGTLLRDLGRNEEAIASLEAAVRADDSAQNFFRLGNLHAELGRTEKAVDAYRSSIKENKKYLPAYYNLGAVLFEAGRDSEALEAYDVALRPVLEALTAGEPVDASNARAFLNLGAIYVRNESWEAALDAYRKALRLNPDLSEARYNEGFIHFRLGDLPAAEQAYRAALALDEELPVAYFHLGLIAERRGRHADALRYLEDAFKRWGTDRLDEPTRIEALVSLGVARRETGKTAEAEEAFRSALALDADNVTALAGLGRLLRRRGDAEARAVLEKARQLSPDDPSVGLELALIARSDGDVERERSTYEQILSRSDDVSLWPVRVNLALLLLRQGDRRAARATFEPVIRRLPELRKTGLDARQGQLMATAYALLLAVDGDLKGARERLGAVLAEDASIAAAREAAAVLDTLAGDPAAGAAALEGVAGAELNLAKMRWLAGRNPGTLPSAAASDIGAQAALGEAALAAGDHGRAVQQLDAAAKLCGGSAPATRPVTSKLRVTVGATSTDALCQRLSASLARALLGSAADALGRSPGSARQDSDRALALPLPRAERPHALFVRGVARAATGDDRGAREDLREALAGQLPEAWVPIARNNLGVALLHLGDVAGARREFEAARASSDEALLNLAILLDDHADDGRGALALYEEYVRKGGPKSRDAAAWAERLRRVYQ